MPNRELEDDPADPPALLVAHLIFATSVSLGVF
jgi:hypothetical protein